VVPASSTARAPTTFVTTAVVLRPDASVAVYSTRSVPEKPGCGV